MFSSLKPPLRGPGSHQAKTNVIIHLMRLTPAEIADICDKVDAILSNVIMAHYRDPMLGEDPETCKQQCTEMALEYLRQEMSQRSTMKEMFEIWAKYRDPGPNPLIQEQKRHFCFYLGLES